MDLDTLDWDAGILAELGIDRALLPEIRGSSEVYGVGTGELSGIPIAGDLGDQQASLFGQACFDAGQVKCTYGTGAFMLMHTGERPVPSSHGLITTVAARLGGPGTPATYALEGSVAVAGSLIQWLRDDLGIISDASEVEALARSVPDSGDIVFVPAFSGLFAPHWRPDARGVIAGLTRYATKAHIARAALEATAYQVADLGAAMVADLGADLPPELRVDGGMVRNTLLMQMQADILGYPSRHHRSMRCRRSGRPTPRDWRSGSGLDSTSCARWIARTDAGSPPWTRQRERPDWRAGTRGSSGRSAGWTEAHDDGRTGSRGGGRDRPSADLPDVRQPDVHTGARQVRQRVGRDRAPRDPAHLRALLVRPLVLRRADDLRLRLRVPG